MKKYKHLTLGERYQIYAYKKSGWTNAAIAGELKVDKTTVGRELWRNLSQRGYRPKHADKLALKRRRGKVNKQITNEIRQEIEFDLSQEFSPEQISGRRALEGKQTVQSRMDLSAHLPG